MQRIRLLELNSEQSNTFFAWRPFINTDIDKKKNGEVGLVHAKELVSIDDTRICKRVFNWDYENVQTINYYVIGLESNFITKNSCILLMCKQCLKINDPLIGRKV